MDDTAIDWTTGQVLQAAARGEPLGAPALTLLLRRYAATGRSDLGEALGPALARALTAGGPAGAGPDEPASDRDAWLALFTEAAGLSEDERLGQAAAAIVAALRGEWPSRAPVGPALRSVNACLAAVPLFAPSEAAGLLQAAIDELERVIGSAYQPGHGVAHVPGGSPARPGELDDHVDAAAALLTAFAATGRLPYSMLAEELMQHARRTWWDEARGGFVVSSAPGPPGVPGADATIERFTTNCSAVRVLCRLAALLQDEEYRKVAVVATDADYGADAERTLDALAPGYRSRGVEAAPYALALGEWLSLRPVRHLQ